MNHEIMTSSGSKRLLVDLYSFGRVKARCDECLYALLDAAPYTHEQLRTVLDTLQVESVQERVRERMAAMEKA